MEDSGGQVKITGKRMPKVTEVQKSKLGCELKPIDFTTSNVEIALLIDWLEINCIWTIFWANAIDFYVLASALYHTVCSTQEGNY